MMGLENRDEKIARGGTGGEYVECPQLHSSLWTTSEHFLDSGMKPVYGLTLDKEQQGFNALDRIYKTSDGWVCIACRQDDRFARLAAATGAVRGDDAATKAHLDAWFAARTSEEAFAALDAAGAPAEVVCETMWIDEALHFDWLEASGRVLDNRTSMYGHIREFGLFNQLSLTPGKASGDGPRLGEHSAELLAEVGYSPQEISDLIARRIAIQPTDITSRIESAVNA
jgi:crotonobetainyl-CoA:carnitine CoA-transferase CaiB-like acyl-CoA transferase